MQQKIIKILNFLIKIVGGLLLFSALMFASGHIMNLYMDMTDALSVTLQKSTWHPVFLFLAYIVIYLGPLFILMPIFGLLFGSILLIDKSEIIDDATKKMLKHLENAKENLNNALSHFENIRINIVENTKRYDELKQEVENLQSLSTETEQDLIKKLKALEHMERNKKLIGYAISFAIGIMSSGAWEKIKLLLSSH